MRETIQRKLRQVEENKSDVEQQRETLKSQIIGLERGNVVFSLALVKFWYESNKNKHGVINSKLTMFSPHSL